MSKVTIMQSQGRSGVFSFTGTITATTDSAIKVEAKPAVEDTEQAIRDMFAKLRSM